MSKRSKLESIVLNRDATVRIVNAHMCNNAIAPARPASVWGYKGCAGKGGKTTNAAIIEKKTEKEKV